MNDELKQHLVMALTTYDRKCANRPGYNRNALGIYFGALDDAMAMIDTGATVRAALLRCYCGRVLSVVLKAAGEPTFTHAEEMAQPLTRD